MEELTNLSACTTQEFYNVLYTLKGIAPINAKIHSILCDIQKDMSLNAQKVLYIYFSLLDDGNTRLPLDSQLALTKWLTKFRSLIKLLESDLCDLPIDPTNAESEFKTILDAGIPELEHCDNIIEERADGQETKAGETSRPFIRATDSKTNIKYLYATRFFDAKCIIERRSYEIFPHDNRTVSKAERKA